MADEQTNGLGTELLWRGPSQRCSIPLRRIHKSAGVTVIDFRETPRFAQRFWLESWARDLLVKVDEGSRTVPDSEPWVLIGPHVRVLPVPLTRYEEHPLVLHMRATREDNEQILQAASPYSWCQFAVIRLCCRFPAARDLLIGCPHLLWLIAEHVMRIDPDDEWIAELLRQQRPSILGTLGLVASKGAVRLLNKIYVREGSEAELRFVRRTLASPERVRLFAHWPVVPVDGLRFARHFPTLARTPAASRWFEENLWTEQLDRILRIIVDKAWDCRHLGVTDPLERIVDAGTLDEMSRALRRLERDHDDQADEELSMLGRVGFPPPPLPSGEQVEPLTSVAEILEEGQKIGNCLANKTYVVNYIERIVRGEAYLYTLYGPIRATIWIAWSDGKWAIEELKDEFNETPCSEALARIHQWFNLATRSTRVLPSHPRGVSQPQLRLRGTVFAIRPEATLDPVERIVGSRPTAIGKEED